MKIFDNIKATNDFKEFERYEFEYRGIQCMIRKVGFNQLSDSDPRWWTSYIALKKDDKSIENVENLWWYGDITYDKNHEEYQIFGFDYHHFTDIGKEYKFEHIEKNLKEIEDELHKYQEVNDTNSMINTEDENITKSIQLINELLKTMDQLNSFNRNSIIKIIIEIFGEAHGI